MVVAFLSITAVAVGALVIAVVLVSVASRREDAAWSLSQPASGPVHSAARRLLGFHSEDFGWTRPKSRCTARAGESTPDGREQCLGDPWHPLPSSHSWPPAGELPGDAWLIPAHPSPLPELTARVDKALGVTGAATEDPASTTPRPASPPG
jgi:hypothetical protein